MKKPKPVPAGSDADKAAHLEGGGALPPNRIGDAADNVEKVAEANARPTEASELTLDEPSTVDALKGGAGALPNSLEPAADNARRAETASQLQSELAAKPENPNEVMREHLRKIVAFVEKKHGKGKAAGLLGAMFGVSDVEKIGVNNLPAAIDEMHKTADAPKEA